MKTLLKIDKFPKSICTRIGNINPEIEQLIPAEIVIDDNNIIKFLPHINEDEIYLEQHTFGVGKTWSLHNQKFAKKIFDYEKDKIVEIGGGSGNVYKIYKEFSNNCNWILIDLNPVIDDTKLNIIRQYYTPDLVNKNDVVVSSHFLEHVFDVEDFLKNLRDRNPKYHIFSIPNFKKYAECNYCSSLMFEHPNFLTEELIEYFLEKTGWKIIEKEYFLNHSIFFVTVPINNIIDYRKFTLDQSYSILNWINYIKNKVEFIKNIDKFYVFGAHFPYYYFLNFGIKEEQIISIVDNDPNKCSKRMYGTNTKIIHSSELPKNSNIVVEMGPYTEEIKMKLKDVFFI